MKQPKDVFLYEPAPTSSRLVIIFSDAISKRFSGYKTFQNVLVNRLFVRDPTRSWYNGPVEGWWDNADGLLERLRTITQRFDPANIICMGSSMGGYAAILFGCKLGVGKIVAFSPQMILDNRLPNSPNTSHDIQYKNIYDVIANTSSTPIEILFGSEDICDTYNMLDANEHKQIRLLNIYGSEHNLMHHFLAHGVLLQIMEGYAVSGQLNISLPLCYFHEEKHIAMLVREAVEAYYFQSPGKAIPALDTLVKYAPQWSAAHCWLGMARMKVNDLTGAAEAFRDAISRVITQAKTAHIELAIALTKLGQYRDAESVLIQSMQLSVTPTARQHHWLGIIYLKQNKLHKAKKAQINAIQLGIGGGESYAEYQLGLINNKLEAYNEAVLHFEKALKLGFNDRNQVFRENLVTALFHSTPPESFDYSRAVKLCPDHPLLAKQAKTQKQDDAETLGQ